MKYEFGMHKKRMLIKHHKLIQCPSFDTFKKAYISSQLPFKRIVHRNRSVEYSRRQRLNSHLLTFIGKNEILVKELVKIEKNKITMTTQNNGFGIDTDTVVTYIPVQSGVEVTAVINIDCNINNPLLHFLSEFIRMEFVKRREEELKEVCRNK